MRLFLILAIGIAALLIAGWESSVIPTYAQYCSIDEQTQAQNCPTYHIVLVSLLELKKLFHDFREEILALGTVGIAIYTWKLWKGAETTSRAQLRAYVMVDSARVDDFGVGKTPVAHLVFKNSGQTPAYNLTHWCRMGVRPFPLVEGIPARGDTSEELPPRPLAPGASMHTSATIKGYILGDQTIQAMARGTGAIYVVGEIRYEDAFGEKRETDFLIFSGGPIGMDGAMASYNSGNRIT
jgi:hypothetical protein